MGKMSSSAIRLGNFATIFITVFITVLIISFFSFAARGQEAPPFMPSLLETDQGTNSLLNWLRADLMRKYEEAQKPPVPASASSIRPARPRPERETRKSGESEPVDISRYLKSESDPAKPPENSKLPVPPPPPASIPEPTADRDLWLNVPIEKRIAFARDLFKRRKFEEARSELEAILEKQGEKKDNLDLILLREKCLFHLREYQIVESDYYRLKNFYPRRKEVQELRQYLFRESGLDELEKAVAQNPADPQAQRALLDRYLRYGWLDFAEEFFLTVQDTSPPTIKSLSEVYYKKGDHAMLIHLSRKAFLLYPQETEFLYNEAVGLYNLGDAISRKEAQEKFAKVASMAGNARLRRNAQWYLQRLASPTR